MHDFPVIVGSLFGKCCCFGTPLCRILLRQHIADSIVLSEPQHVEHDIADLDVAPFDTHGEHLGFLFRAHRLFLPQRRVESFEFRFDLSRCRIFVKEQGILFAVEHLALQLAADAGPQQIGRLTIEPVNVAKIDLVIGGVLQTLIVIGPQKTVREPLHPIRE